MKGEPGETTTTGDLFMWGPASPRQRSAMAFFCLFVCLLACWTEFEPQSEKLGDATQAVSSWTKGSRTHTHDRHAGHQC